MLRICQKKFWRENYFFWFRLKNEILTINFGLVVIKTDLKLGASWTCDRPKALSIQIVSHGCIISSLFKLQKLITPSDPALTNTGAIYSLIYL